MKIETKTLLVTKEQSAFPELKNWCIHKGIRLILRSFISIEPLENLEIPKTGWIFFSSPKGAQAFLSHYTIKAKKIAVYGEATRLTLAEYGLQADFTGDELDSPQTIGKKFQSFIGTTATVFFPISQLSKKSISTAIDKKQSVEIVTYHTLPRPHQLTNTPEFILFTSPSNFESYRSTNTIKAATRLIAIGKTTEAAMRLVLEEREILVLDSPTDASLITLLERLF